MKGIDTGFIGESGKTVAVQCGAVIIKQQLSVCQVISYRCVKMFRFV